MVTKTILCVYLQDQLQAMAINQIHTAARSIFAIYNSLLMIEAFSSRMILTYMLTNRLIRILQKPSRSHWPLDGTTRLPDSM